MPRRPALATRRPGLLHLLVAGALGSAAWGGWTVQLPEAPLAEGDLLHLEPSCTDGEAPGDGRCVWTVEDLSGPEPRPLSQAEARSLSWFPPAGSYLIRVHPVQEDPARALELKVVVQPSGGAPIEPSAPRFDGEPPAAASAPAGAPSSFLPTGSGSYSPSRPFPGPRPEGKYPAGPAAPSRWSPWPPDRGDSKGDAPHPATPPAAAGRAPDPGPRSLGAEPRALGPGPWTASAPAAPRPERRLWTLFVATGLHPTAMAWDARTSTFVLVDLPPSGAPARIVRLGLDGRQTLLDTADGKALPGGRPLKLVRQSGIATLPDGGIVLADTGNHRVLLLDPDGGWSVLAGTGQPGWREDLDADGRLGRADASPLNQPMGVAATPEGVVVADRRNGRVCLVTPGGFLRTLARHGQPCDPAGPGADRQGRQEWPVAVAAGLDGTVFYSAEGKPPAVRAISPDRKQIRALDGRKGAAKARVPWIQEGLSRPGALALLPDGTLAVVDGQNTVLHGFDLDGRLEALAGTWACWRKPAGPDEAQASLVPLALETACGSFLALAAVPGGMVVAEADGRIRLLTPGPDAAGLRDAVLGALARLQAGDPRDAEALARTLAQRTSDPSSPSTADACPGDAKHAPATGSAPSPQDPARLLLDWAARTCLDRALTAAWGPQWGLWRGRIESPSGPAQPDTRQAWLTPCRTGLVTARGLAVDPGQRGTPPSLLVNGDDLAGGPSVWRLAADGTGRELFPLDRKDLGAALRPNPLALINGNLPALLTALGDPNHLGYGGLVGLPNGCLGLADRSECQIWRCAPDGSQHLLAGAGAPWNNLGGHQDPDDQPRPALEVILDAPTALATAPGDGLLFVQPRRGNVCRLEPDGTLATLAGPAQGLRWPLAAAQTADGAVVVLDDVGMIHRIRPGEPAAVLARCLNPDAPPSEETRTRPPGVPLAVTAQGDLWFFHRDESTLWRITPDRRLLAGRGGAEAPFRSLGGLAPVPGRGLLAFERDGRIHYLCGSDQSQLDWQRVFDRHRQACLAQDFAAAQAMEAKVRRWANGPKSPGDLRQMLLAPLSSQGFRLPRRPLPADAARSADPDLPVRDLRPGHDPDGWNLPEGLERLVAQFVGVGPAEPGLALEAQFGLARMIRTRKALARDPAPASSPAASSADKGDSKANEP